MCVSYHFSVMETNNYENDEENNVERMNEENHDELNSNPRRCSSVSVGDVIVSKQCERIKTNGAW